MTVTGPLSTVPQSLLDWPDSYFEIDQARLAGIALSLLLEPSRWINRRHDRIEFVDASRVQRAATIAYTVPNLVNRVPPVGVPAAPLFLPMALMKKDILRNLSVRGADGSDVPTLNRSQTRAVELTMLTSLARRALGPSRPIPEHIAADIATVVERDGQAVDDALRRIRAGTAPPRLRLRRSTEFITLVEDLASNFVLFVLVAEPPGSRGLITIAYEETPRFRATTAEGDEDKWPQRRDWLLQRLALRPQHVEVSASGIGFAQSYHAEVAIPQQLMVTRAELWPADPAREQQALTVDATGLSSAHLYVQGLPRQAAGTVRLDLRLLPGGFLVQAMFATLAITAILLIGSILKGEHVGERPEAVSALILAVPGAVAGYLAGPAEHPLVQKLIDALRLLVLSSAFLAFAAAATLTLQGVRPGLVPTLWKLGAGLAAMVAAVVAAGYVTCWMARQQRVSAAS